MKHVNRKLKKKIKFSLEELPTFEQMKKSSLSLYKEWKCLLCGRGLGTVDHSRE